MTAGPSTAKLPMFVLHWNNPEGALRTARSLRAPVDVTIIENGSRCPDRTPDKT